MKKTFIYCILCICIALTGCASVDSSTNSNLPVQMGTYRPQGRKLYADTMELREAYTAHEGLRTLFKQAASGSLMLRLNAPDHHDYQNGYYAESESSDDSLRKKTDDAISKIEKRLPGVHMRMLEIEKGILCVSFSIVKNTTGDGYGYYEEDLMYSPNSVAWDKTPKLMTAGGFLHYLCRNELV